MSISGTFGGNLFLLNGSMNNDVKVNKELYNRICEFKNKPRCKRSDYSKYAPEGMWLEFGVATGATLKELADSAPEGRIVYGFDCWEGLPEDWEGYMAKGAFKTDPKSLTFLPKNTRLVDGLFEDSLPKFLEEHKEPVALVHVDCDIYSSTVTIFRNLKDRFVDGAVIIFDELIDYGGNVWQIHEWKAFNEFLDETGYKVEVLGLHGKQPGRESEDYQVGVRIFKNEKNS